MGRSISSCCSCSSSLWNDDLIFQLSVLRNPRWLLSKRTGPCSDKLPAGFVVATGVHLHTTCTVSFTNENGGALTAWATIWMSIATGLLVWIARQQYVTSRAQLRAYVLPQAIGLYDGTTVKPKQRALKNFPSFELSMKNTGQTPAYDVVGISYITAGELVNEEALCEVEPATKFTPFTVGPGISFPRYHWMGRVLTPHEIAGLSTNPATHAVFVYGRFEYDDAFGRHHYTNFRYAYCGKWPPAPASGAGICQNGNDSN